MRVGKFLVAAALVLCVSTSAHAAFSVEWVPVPITAPTDGSPANITGFETWDLMLTKGSGDDFQSARIYIDPAGPIFQHSFGGNGPPNAALVPAFPALQYDTYLEGPNAFGTVGGMTILGGSTPDGQADTPTGTFDTNLISVAVGDTTTSTAAGTFRLLRLTFDGAVPQANGRVSVNVGGTGTQSQPLPQIGGVIPEPASLGLLALVGLAGLRRRSA